jgi:hypothetical protein
VLYNIGCTTNLCDQFPSVALTPEAQFWMETMTFVVGGVGFLAAGFLYIVDREGAGFIRGVRPDQTSSTLSAVMAACRRTCPCSDGADRGADRACLWSQRRCLRACAQACLFPRAAGTWRPWPGG